MNFSVLLGAAYSVLLIFGYFYGLYLNQRQAAVLLEVKKTNFLLEGILKELKR